ncbi:MAG: M15 family metallopeptidase [Firmicutes bacterium]|nr:M15 family metallopeptidase [Bacillota bacterium]
MKKFRLLAVILSAVMMCMMFTGCGSDKTADESSETAVNDGSGIDYMVLVNKENKLPDGWEEALDTVKIKDSQGWDVEVEKTAYEAYLKLKEDLEKDDVRVDLDSAYRSVKEQKRIVKEFTEKYGEDYVKEYVAVPGYSEHHTGLALDLYLNIDGKDIYENEDMVKYPEVWAKIHKKLADYGFILRYMEGKEDITGYSYEPWHIRYIDDVDAAKEIAEKGISLEEYLDKVSEPVEKVE